MSLLLLEGVSAPPVIVRPPLPLPLPRADRDGVPWATTLPWDPPHTRDYLRANLWGIVMPGAPWMPGLSSDFWWEDGNGGCDCERARCFAAAAGEPDPNEPCVIPGQDYRYTVLRFELPDGRIVDPQEPSGHSTGERV
jgi:hypothetical protein